jgi:hypothetical protein
MKTLSTDEVVDLLQAHPPESAERLALRELLVRRDQDEWIPGTPDQPKPQPGIAVLGVLENVGGRWVQEVYYDPSTRRWQIVSDPTPYAVVCWKHKPVAPGVREMPSLPAPPPVRDPMEYRRRA